MLDARLGPPDGEALCAAVRRRDGPPRLIYRANIAAAATMLGRCRDER